MTSETKKYIELSDFLALRFTCKGCQSALDVPLSRPLTGREDEQKLNTCPVCLKPWALQNGGSYHQTIAGFGIALRAISEMQRNVGFNLTLQVTDEKPKDPKP
jgi:hypothetical protein